LFDGNSSEIEMFSPLIVAVFFELSQDKNKEINPII